MKARVAYLLSRFPQPDETFLLREMVAVEAAGVDVLPVSLRRRLPQAVVHRAARRFEDRVLCPGWLSPAALGALLWLFLVRPLRFAVALARLVAESWHDPVFLAKSLALLPKASLLALVLPRRVDRVHAGWATHPATVAWWIGRLSGLPWSLSAHAHDLYDQTTFLDVKLREADFVSTCTAHNLRVLMTEWGLPPAHVHLVRHGLELDRFAPPEGPGRAPGDPFVVVSVGSLLPIKGFDTLVRTVAAMASEPYPVRLCIVGGGPEEAGLRTLARELGVALDLPGFLEQDQVAVCLRAAHAFALLPPAATHWGIPNVLVEAAACGLPVVCTPLPSVPEVVVDGETGYLVPEKDPQAAAAALAKLGGDPETARAMGRAGRARVLDLYDLAATGRAMAALLG